VHSAATAIADVTRAWQTAVHDRRTVVLNLPLDVQSAPAPESAGTVARPSAPEPVRPAQSAVEQFAALLSGASRPVFVTGRGGRAAGPEISALAEHAGALVATSAVANGLFRGEEFDLGISGGFSAPLTARLIANADLLVGWGCALNMWTMRHGSLIGPDARVVQIDDTASALGAHRPIDLGIHGDCASTAIDVLTELARNTKARNGYRTPKVSDELSARRWWNDTETPDLSTSATIDPRPFTKALDDMLPTERVVAIDSGNFMGYPSTYLRVPDHMGFCFTQAFQSIGLGLSSGIGAALAQPDRLAVVGTGDGGFMMGISELETAVRLGRPMLVAVYNDAAYGAEVHHFQHLPHDGAPADLTTVTFPDFDIAAVARGFGARGVTVRSLDDLDEVRRWAAAPEGVMVVDAKIAADGGAWWLAEAFKGH
jgi:thiamine pyrophosphate-dependent acetolactate synthase large subunit-like protein